MNARPDVPGAAPAERYAFPASFAQQRLWFLEQLEGAGPVWNVRLPVRLTGPLDAALLEQALAIVVARHESLRTTFGMRGGEILQFVASELIVPLTRVTLPTPGLEGREVELRRLLGELAGHVFDLRDGPLLRVWLVRVGPEDHALLILSHHIVADGWSSGVLFRDLAAAYDALVRGHQPVLPDLPVQYADFAVWQREWLTGPELDAQAAFWREHLAGAPALLEMPLDRPRPRLQSYRGNRIGHALPEELTARLHQVAAAEGVTLFMLLFAAFNLLLARWSGQWDLVVGTPIAGRRRTELEGLVGFFANTLALRTRVDSAGDFRQLLRQVRATALEAFTHQDLPFEKLVEILRPPRSLAHSPLFQVMFALQNAPWEAERCGDLRVAPAEVAPGGTARFDLSVSASEYEGRLWLGLEYGTDLFAAATIERLATGFEALLEAVTREPAAAVALLPVQSPADLRRQLVGWQPVPTEIPACRLIDLFAAQVRRSPDAVAVECAGLPLSYGELARRAAQIAAALSAAGMDDAQPVALCLPRTPDMLAALLGVLQAGGHYLPLDPSHPPERLALVLEDSGAGILLTTSTLAPRLPAFRGLVLRLDEAPGTAPAVEQAKMPGAAPEAAKPAYLIYTSGSTGRPKGVLVAERAVVNFLASMGREPGLAAGDRLLAVTTLAFDIAVLELLLPLTVGATTVLATDEQVQDPAELIRLLDGGCINVMQATPALWRNLVTAGWRGDNRLRIFCGGEALDRELARELLQRGAELWNLYGPTETTIWSCLERVTDEAGPVSVGRPIANTRCYVLDEQLQPVPIGARGELWIGGAGVALGYHRQAGLTAERFRPDPLQPGTMYRTGDVARWRADGRLEILGRTDFQLKLRGFRLEPGEIEAALLARPGVRAALVVLREVAGDPRLVAYLVAGPDRPPDAALLEQLGRSLPAWMLPSHLVWLPALPLTPNGKVDRAALPPPDAPDGAALPDTSGAGSPATVVERSLSTLFRELLGVPVGLDDDFFARGGHSLLATRLVAQVRAEFQVALPLRAIFETPTVRGLAASLPAGTMARAEAATAARLQPGASVTQAAETVAPLSLVQQRLWFLDRLQPGNPVYHLAWAFELTGPLDVAALQTALDGLVVRQGSLRTHFRDRDGEPEQVISASGGLPLQVRTFSDGTPLAAQLAEAADFAAMPFRLSTGPLVRAQLLASGPGTHLLLIVIHHIVADGWSFGVLSRELAEGYAAARRGTSAVLPRLPRAYADYVREQRRALADGELARQLAYWQAALRGAPPFIDLPVDRPRPLLPSQRGARLTRTLGTGLQVAVRDLARAEGCTSFMVLLAAFSLLLARQCGTEDVVVGTPVAGRSQPELEGLVGFFVNTLVLRTDLSGNPTVRQLLGRVRAMTIGAYEHADVPFELLVETLEPPRSTSRTPLFQVLFNLHSEPGIPLALEGLEVRSVAIPRQTAKFDLSVSLAETRDGLAVTVEYSTDLFLAASVERMLADYAALLAAFAAEPAARLAAVPFSPRPAAQPAAVVADILPGSLTAAFAEWVARTPDAPAVSAPAIGGCPAIDWSYADLAREARAIAAALAGAGVVPGDRVGLWFGQSAGQVAGMLGVLQAGAAYVPLDPLAPVARLARIVGDAGLRVLVTDRSAPEPAPLADHDLLVLRREELPPAGAVALPAPDPDALAYLLYTSGSTGAPKGVPQSQRNVLHFVHRWSRNLGLRADDRLSLLSTYGYDAAVQDVFGALLTGAAVCPLDVRRLDRETLLDRIADRGLTVLHGTPTVYRYLFGGRVACRQDLSRVRLVVLGGEVARRADFELFRARFRRGARLVNGYGLTEATAVCQWFADHDTLPYGQQLPIGWPLPGAAGQGLRLLDASGEPAGVIGEIVLDDPHVAADYWRLQAGGPSGAAGPPAWRCHAPAPGGPAAPEGPPVFPGPFRTGDRARYLPDGSLAYAGRLDQRLKIGGIRIEPGDVEAALREAPGVGEAVAMGIEDAPGEPVLVAFYTAQPGAQLPEEQALRSRLGGLLPPALVPARLVRCASLPRLPNGKVDRQALARQPAAPAMPAADSPAPDGPGNAAEATLLEIWRTLLKRPAVGLDDDFFLLGGHSLMATRLVARIRDRLGVDLPLIRVFEAPTIRALARFIGPAGIQMRPPGD